MENGEISAKGGSALGGKKEILKYSLISLILISSLLGWLSVYRAVTVTGASPWLVPIIWFSLFVIFLCLAVAATKEFILVELATVAAFLLSLIFVLSPWHFLIIVIASALAFSGLRQIRNDLDLNIKISLWKSFHTGKSRIILSIVFLICSLYFFTIKNASGPKVIPKLDLTPITQKLVNPVLAIINPDFKQISKEEITVDQFIITTQESNRQAQLEASANIASELVDSQIPQELSEKQKEILKTQALKNITDSQKNLSQKNIELVLAEGHRQLSELAGRNVSGDEKISAVFAGLVDKKINDYFSAQIQGQQGSSAAPSIFALILFFTILPLGVLLGNLWFAIAIGLFWLLVRSGVVEITKISVEREMIA